MKAALAALTALFAIVTAAYAETPAIPDALKPWSGWVLDRHPEYRCAVGSAGNVCVWPGVLKLEIDESTGTFRLDATVDRRSGVELPGGGTGLSNTSWPESVSALRDGKEVEVAVSRVGDRPTAILEPGTYSIQGRFNWSRLPDSILVPAGTVRIELTLKGSAVPAPRMDSSGRLFFRLDTPAESAETDSAELTISRRLQDGIPFVIETRIDLKISGHARELIVPKAVLPGALPVSISTGFPFQLLDTGDLRLNVRAGRGAASITALYPVPPVELKNPTQGIEYWVFVSNDSVRAVRIEDATGIDPAQSPLPPEWRDAPAYAIGTGEGLKLVEVRRGDGEMLPNDLRFARTMWLDFNGSGFTVQDALDGTMNREFRLDLAKPYVLEHVASSGVDQLITTNPLTGESGVEIRDRQFSLQGEWHINREGGALPAVAWNHDMSSGRISLILPPGWSLFHVSGVDYAMNTWISSWSLSEVFFCLFVTAVAYRLFHRRGAVLALLTLLLTHTSPDAPQLFWLNILGTRALAEVLPAGRWKNLMGWYLKSSLAILLLWLTGFSIDEIRTAMYPQLEYPWTQVGGANFAPQSVASSYRVEQQGVGAVVDQLNMPTASEPYQSGILSREGKLSKKNFEKYTPQNFQRLDPNAVIQTGKGVPKWQWKQWQFGWNGPVRADETYRVVLIGPWTLALIRLSRVGLCFTFAALFLNFTGMRQRLRAALGAAVILLLPLYITGTADAQSLPSKELLDELEARLTRDRCTSDCHHIQSIELSVNGSEVRGTMVVGALAPAQVILPGPIEQLSIGGVFRDGQETRELVRAQGQFASVKVMAGTHIIKFVGTAFSRSTFTLIFPDRPGTVRVNTSDWQVDGIGEAGAVENSIQLTRKEKGSAVPDSGEASDAEAQILPSWFTVERKLVLGIPWVVRTEVQRWGTHEHSAFARVKLIPGEAPLSAEFKVENGEIIIPFSRGAQAMSWEGSIAESKQLQLTADERNSEVWEIECTESFSCSYGGTLPLEGANQSARQIFRFRPIAGETAVLDVTRLSGVSGARFAFEKTTLAHRPGERITESTLTVTVKGSTTLQHPIKLPAGAELISVSKAGSRLEARARDGVLELPISPGVQYFEVQFRVNEGNRLVQPLPGVTLGSTARNVEVTATVPTERWLLWSRGPVCGPAILFWAQLLIIIVLSYFLSRITEVPLGFAGWSFLGFGMLNVGLVGVGVPMKQQVRSALQPEISS